MREELSGRCANDELAMSLVLRFDGFAALQLQLGFHVLADLRFPDARKRLLLLYFFSRATARSLCSTIVLLHVYFVNKNMLFLSVWTNSI